MKKIIFTLALAAMSSLAIGQNKSEPINSFCYFDSKEDMTANVTTQCETSLYTKDDLIIVPIKNKYIMAIKKEHSAKMVALLSKKEIGENPLKLKHQGNIHTSFLNAVSSTGEKMTLKSAQIKVYYVNGSTMLKTYEKTVDGKTCPVYVIIITDDCLEGFINTFK